MVPFLSSFVLWWPTLLRQRQVTPVEWRFRRGFLTVYDRITYQKLDENNYWQRKRVIEVYVLGWEKVSHLLADPPTPVIDASLEDNNLLYHVLTMMKPTIQDLILHCMTVKELWCFLRELYRGSLNISMTYDIIQELFGRSRTASPWLIIRASSIA